MWGRILCKNMEQLLLCFCIEALFIVAEGYGEKIENASCVFRELDDMALVANELYASKENLYLDSEMAYSLERYRQLFDRICSTPKDCNMQYEEGKSIM